MPGVPEVIAALDARDDVTQSLLTGNIEPNAHVKLAALGLDGAAGHGDRRLRLGQRHPPGAGGHRPPQGRSGCAGSRWRRADTVLIGDTPLDVHAAHQNGARAVAVATGRFSVSRSCWTPAPTRCCPTRRTWMRPSPRSSDSGQILA